MNKTCVTVSMYSSYPHCYKIKRNTTVQLMLAEICYFVPTCYQMDIHVRNIKHIRFDGRSWIPARRYES